MYLPFTMQGSQETPLTISALKGHHDVVSHLIAWHANVDKKNSYGLTALHIGSKKGHMEVVKVLLKAHAKIDKVTLDRSRSTPLMLAAQEGHHDIVNLLILCSANVDKNNSYGLTALHIGSMEGHMEVVKVLLKAHAKIDKVTLDRSRSTPLMLAAREGHHDVVGHLILCSANVDKKNQDNQTALHMASVRGHMEVVKALLKAHAKVDEMAKRESSPLMQLAARKGHRDQYCETYTALHYASERGDLKMVKVLLNAGAKTDVDRRHRFTPLMLAACEGHQEVVGHLIARSARLSVDRTDLDNRTALHYASERGNLEVVKMLLSSGAKIDKVDNNYCTPLSLATRNKHVEVISYLLYAEMTNLKQDVSSPTAPYASAGHMPSGSTLQKVSIVQLPEPLHPKSQLGRDVLSYAVNPKYKYAHKYYTITAKVLIASGVGIEGLLSTSPPMTALMLTAKKGDESLTKQVIRQGVNVNYQNPDGLAALHFAARSGQLEIVKILLNNGAEIDLQDKHHYTPLVLSVKAMKYDVMRHLITSGADVTQLAEHLLVDRGSGREALLYAVNHKYKDIAIVLITNGVAIEGLLSTSPPMTALMLTAKKGDESLTKQVIRQGVNVNYQNPDGLAALHFAARSGQLEMVKILLNNGAEIDLQDIYHRTPLVLSVKATKYDVMRHLITSGADVTQLAEHLLVDRDFGREALLYAVNHKYKDIAIVLITNGVAIEGLLSTSPPMTALMLTAKMGDVSLTKQLILQGVNVNYQNPDGHTAVHFAAKHNHIQCGILLAEAGADVSVVQNKASQTPFDLSRKEFKDAILQTLSFQTKKTVCVIGNAMSGKSTLIASLQNENAWFWIRFRNRVLGVRDISERTAGIEPVSLSSKRYGDVMFFDFAGQHEYHGPHEMFLESILSKGLSTVTIIVVVKVTEEESAICHQLNRWLHPFVKMSSSANPVRVIVIGSQMDKVKNEVEVKVKLEFCYETIKDSLHDFPVTFEDLCYLDCRQPYSSDISKLCQYLKDVPPPQNKAMHIGYSIPWVITRIRSSIDKKVVSVSEFSDWIVHNQANLPTNLPPAEEVCKDLSSTGHFLYLPSKEGTSNGWLVLDLPSILHKVYGTLFSPSKRTVNKFGLLNCQRLSVLFPTFDLSMIRDVLISLEFCIEVDPSVLSESTHLMDSSDEGHDYLFFPALVSAKPPIVFNDECEGNYILCWQLEVSENSFLSPRLLQTIILRFATHYVFRHQQGSESRQHYCKVWGNGIFWQSTEDVDIAVQISDNAVVQVIGRSQVSPEGLCMYLSRIIQDIFTTIRHLSPSLEGVTYIIHPGKQPQALLENPRSPSPQKMFLVNGILESKKKGRTTCLSCNAEDEIAKRKAVSDVFGGFQPSVDVIERFSLSACECVLVYIYICTCI